MIRTVTALVMKEFHQVMRDRIMLRMIFIIPVVQLILLGYVINTDVKNIPTALYDCDHSRSSRDLARSFSPGGYFILSAPDTPLLDAERDFERNRFTATLIIPEDFSEQLDQRRRVTAALIVDGANANSAGLTIGYANIIAAQFNRRLAGLSAPITLRQRMLYNPEAESVNFMVPGIVALLLTMITTMLTSMAIVREREAGTLEQLMVTPIPTPALILGKTIPFAILGFIEMSIALAIGILWFAIPFAGSWLLLYTLSFLYLFTTLGVGMFVSTISKTQQQAMFLTWFFTIFAILTSGFFTPINNMPELVQYLTYLNPLRYFLTIVRGIMMKGAGVDVLHPEILALVIFGMGIFTLSWLRFSKRVK